MASQTEKESSPICSWVREGSNSTVEEVKLYIPQCNYPYPLAALRGRKMRARGTSSERSALKPAIAIAPPPGEFSRARPRRGVRSIRYLGVPRLGNRVLDLFVRRRQVPPIKR